MHQLLKVEYVQRIFHKNSQGIRSVTCALRENGTALADKVDIYGHRQFCFSNNVGQTIFFAAFEMHPNSWILFGLAPSLPTLEADTAQKCRIPSP